jgi:prepilin-type N-terminal cleavage/methylation domain-containing protein
MGGSDRNQDRAGFSLVEMLLVIAVIALLIGMLMPALSGARQTAIRVKTQSMLADLSNAAQRFGNDNSGRNPGYFSEALMGHSDNNAIGMSAMENAMLDLGGSRAVLARADDPNAPAANPEAGIIIVGPSDQEENQVVVNLNLIGAEGAYYTPEQKFFLPQLHDNTVNAQQRGSAAGTGQALMPDVLDAWGNPLLAWSQDPGAPTSLQLTNDADEVYTQIARVSSDGVGDLGDTTGPAWFYLDSNSAFLEAPSFGSSGIDMSADPLTGRASTIGAGVADLERLRTLASLLASSNSYQLDPSVDGLENANFEEVYPSRARGRFLVHSAGTDGIYLNSTDPGWAENGHSDGTEYHIDFGNTYFDQNNVRYTDDNGAFTNIDLFEPFDDLMFGTK